MTVCGHAAVAACGLAMAVFGPALGPAADDVFGPAMAGPYREGKFLTDREDAVKVIGHGDAGIQGHLREMIGDRTPTGVENIAHRRSPHDTIGDVAKHALPIERANRDEIRRVCGVIVRFPAQVSVADGSESNDPCTVGADPWSAR